MSRAYLFIGLMCLPLSAFAGKIEVRGSGPCETNAALAGLTHYSAKINSSVYAQGKTFMTAESSPTYPKPRSADPYVYDVAITLHVGDRINAALYMITLDRNCAARSLKLISEE